jgi:ribose transport system permease protein
VTILVCGSVGLLNGVLIGYLRLRAFLTTLVTLIIVRAVVDMLAAALCAGDVAVFADSAAWDFIGMNNVFGMPVSFAVLVVVALIGHIVITRSRFGWRAMAIGGSRRSAHNIGLPVRGIVCAAYTISGMLCGLAGVLYAARLSGAGSDTGMGMEIMALTAAVLGGNSLGGGRGSVVKALIGAVIVLIMTNGVLRLGLNSGSGPMVLGLVLLRGFRRRALAQEPRQAAEQGLRLADPDGDADSTRHIARDIRSQRPTIGRRDHRSWRRREPRRRHP